MQHTKNSSQSVILNSIQNQSKHRKSLFSAFTLVELIVMIVILAILSTIAFLSFNSYSSSSRDSVRLADITNIAKGLTLQYTVGGYYIIPDNAVNLYSGSTLIGYQGKAGSNTLNTIKLSANTNNTSGRDPIDNTYYTYNTNINKNRYQVTGYLENKGTIINRTSYINNSIENTNRNNEQTLNNRFRIKYGMTLNELLSFNLIYNSELINQTYATTYTNRFPYLKGDSIGVILNYTGTTSNPIYTPIEDITTSTGIDISSGTLTTGKVVISNNTDSSTGVSIVSMSGYVNSNGSCINPPLWYGINIGNPSQFNVPYQTSNSSAACYMTGCANGHTGASCNQIDSNTVLLLHLDGNLNDSSPSNKTALITNGGVTYSGGNNNYSQAGFFGPTGNYLFLSNSSDWNFGTSNFTIDFWVNSSWTGAYSPGYEGFMTTTPNWTQTTARYWYVYGYGNGVNGTVCFSDAYGASPWGMCSGSILPLNTWTHVAIVRNGDIISIYLDGNLIISKSHPEEFNSDGTGLYIGRYYTTANQYNLMGKLDEIRITKGVARRTSNFIPPNIPY